MSTVAVIDYGMCNLDSVRRAVEECGRSACVTDRWQDLESATHVIVPGVGAFPEGMRNLRRRSLEETLREQVVEKGIPCLGICLGMQMLAGTGLEGELTTGLGFIEGQVQRLQTTSEDFRLPHIGWNEVVPVRDSPLFRGIGSGQDFYFVHSFHLRPAHDDDVLARTAFGAGFVSAIQRELIFGVQFHPEKSQRAGLQLLKNFLAV
jgi:glutamine amidotransferase